MFTALLILKLKKMLNNILILGKRLSNTEQINIKGGATRPSRCNNEKCKPGYCCGSDPYNCELAEHDGSNCR